MWNEAFSRRDFLSHSGKGLMTAALTTSVFSHLANSKTQAASAVKPSGQTDDPAPLPISERVGYAVVGLGKLSQEQILPAIAQCKKSRLVALVSGDAQKAQRLGKDYGVSKENLYDYSTYDRLADNPAVQVIYIVLPNHMHKEYTIRGAQAGKHILCEKPMANSVEDCQAMIDACKKANRYLMIAYRCQYEPYNRKAIQICRDKSLGMVKHIVAENGQNQLKNETPWRLKKAQAGGGALPDVGIYCLNAARYLTGEEPIEISARFFSTPGDARFTEVEESVNFLLRFPSGTTAACLTSYGAYTSRRYNVLATEGTIILDPAFAYSNLAMKTISGPDTKDVQADEHHLPVKNQFALEMDHMSMCVTQNKTPHTPGEEGRQDMMLIEKIYESANTGQVIHLPPVTGLDVYRGTPVT